MIIITDKLYIMIVIPDRLYKMIIIPDKFIPNDMYPAFVSEAYGQARKFEGTNAKKRKETEKYK